MVHGSETTRYAKSGDVHIAYQVLGDGPLDLVFSPSPVSNLELVWEWPPFERFLRRLASFSRLILFDKRGTGLSDRVTDAATLEERMDDLRAVMDAAGSEQAAIFGTSEGGPLALLFTATYPSRVSSLVLYGSYAKSINSDDYHSGVDAGLFEAGMELMEKDWGDGALVDVFAPSVNDDEDFRRWWGRYERQSASPGAAVAIQRLNAELDVRAILPSVHVPTLILYRAGEFVAHVKGSKYLAEHIAGAEYVELDGVDYHPYVGDQDAILDRVEEFLVGSRQPIVSDHVLATLLFIETGNSATDTQEVVDRLVRRSHGQLVHHSEGSYRATFDGPSRAIGCALEVRRELGDLGVDVSMGAHVGEIESTGDQLRGDAVEIAAHVQATAENGQILISRTLADLAAGTDAAITDAGAHDLGGGLGRWDLFEVGSSDDRAKVETPARPRAAVGAFRCEGDFWLLTFADESLRVRDSRGLHDIATLLAQPGVEVHVAELVGSANDLGPRPVSDPHLDEQAISAYRARLHELADEIDQADAAHDLGRADRAREEHDALVDRLTSDLGLGARPRTTDDWVERARKAVRARIATSLKRIDSGHPPLGRHLRASLRTGVFCSYEPPEPVAWLL